jgi:Transferase family
MTKGIFIHPQSVREKRVFPLSPSDCLQSVTPPIAFSFFYGQTISVQRLQKALEQTLVDFPYLSGRIHRTSSRKHDPFQVQVHPTKGGALLVTTSISKPYPTKEDRRWFPIFTGIPFPGPHEPTFSYGPLLKVKVTHVTSTNSSVMSFGFCHAVMDVTTVGAFLETLQAHYDGDGEVVPKMAVERMKFTTKEGEPTGSLDRFTTCTLLQAIPKLIKINKHINLTMETSELQRLKGEFLRSLDGALDWVSTYEMIGVILLRAFCKASQRELESSNATDIEFF